jgi:glycosyltransferase involved in cell wall biosynthesis
MSKKMDIRAKDYPTISVILCALNEEQNLPRVLKEIPGWVDEVLLIDGHSVDKTAEIASLFSNKIRILYQPAKGKSDALLHGVEQARGEIIVTIDADGATPPGEIEKFVAPLIEGYDLSKGSRLKGKRFIDGLATRF